jgi:hypothetical protein
MERTAELMEKKKSQAFTPNFPNFNFIIPAVTYE